MNQTEDDPNNTRLLATLSKLLPWAPDVALEIINQSQSTPTKSSSSPTNKNQGGDVSFPDNLDAERMDDLERSLSPIPDHTANEDIMDEEDDRVVPFDDAWETASLAHQDIERMMDNARFWRGGGGGGGKPHTREAREKPLAASAAVQTGSTFIVDSDAAAASPSASSSSSLPAPLKHLKHFNPPSTHKPPRFFNPLSPPEEVDTTSFHHHHNNTRNGATDPCPEAWRTVDRLQSELAALQTLTTRKQGELRLALDACKNAGKLRQPLEDLNWLGCSCSSSSVQDKVHLPARLPVEKRRKMSDTTTTTTIKSMGFRWTNPRQ
ncbi:hypothetical protein DFS34DRAFT_695803 [Phlyctochytrium arcticum]|nr:hypothetical protein DFS34DRAFT_695803 [Phlyctochytrium arcticum]